MNLRALKSSDESLMQTLLHDIELFNQEEIDVVNELLGVYLHQEDKKDYQFFGHENEHGSLVSFICFGPTPMTKNTFDLYWIGTHPQLRGKGLAVKLIDHMKKTMITAQAKLIRVETSSKELYANTQAFYDRLNFIEAARIKDFYNDNDDLITYIMRVEN